jgi:hypothetical protein
MRPALLRGRTALIPFPDQAGRRPTRYRLVVRGELHCRFAGAFPGMNLHPTCGRTMIVGDVVDQSHLHGILDRLRNLGIELISLA